jgi:hypothetical protein
MERKDWKNMEKKTIDLAISENYLRGLWGIKEAVREIYQNCVDAGPHEIEADEEGGTLTFTTHAGRLVTSDLALGSTSKAEDSTKIGKFGEGLKVGFVALLREGCGIVIHNGGQLWTPHIAMSENLVCRTLHVDIEDDPDTKPSDDVSIEVSGIQDFDEIAGISIEMTEIVDGEEPTETSETKYGTIIHDADFSGKIYVGGIFVTKDDDVTAEDEDLPLGFDFKPQYVHLDRDRKLINYHELMDLAASAICDEGDGGTVYDCYKYTKMSDSIVQNLGELSDDGTEEFFRNYFNGKREKETEDGKTEDPTFENAILVSEETAAYLKSKPANRKYIPIVEKDNDIIERFREVSDEEKNEFCDQIEEEAEAWTKVKNSLPELLQRFNESDYKKALYVINVCESFKVPQIVVNIIKLVFLAHCPTYQFEPILRYIKADKVDANDYVISPEDIAKIGSDKDGK